MNQETMGTADALLLVDAAIREQTVDAALDALRAVNASTDSARRLAVDRLVDHLGAVAPERPRPVVDLLLALRRVQ